MEPSAVFRQLWLSQPADACLDKAEPVRLPDLELLRYNACPWVYQFMVGLLVAYALLWVLIV